MNQKVELQTKSINILHPAVTSKEVHEIYRLQLSSFSIFLYFCLFVFIAAVLLCEYALIILNAAVYQ